jgi:hypothetical protein
MLFPEGMNTCTGKDRGSRIFIRPSHGQASSRGRRLERRARGTAQSLVKLHGDVTGRDRVRGDSSADAWRRARRWRWPPRHGHQRVATHCLRVFVRIHGAASGAAPFV